ncbi:MULTISPECIES: cytochrome c [unclassified Cupriavidus]|uniref:SorB family sulfite dehydrogenase c-type cytochrome subunit n=1 Tax=unclassified Cupriavidus TaxID=2640874 RepID=UPI001C001119|nr:MULTISPECIES: cytochrome c [unclassified Cupriavidus]MCA3191700.1 cytochrome c [Cupriavidus sp.]MCA3197930.1 cytochrome c [Cupriavidus sp.]MCA3200614.1 cytochrome c [Cupriavidus sp.]MCA3207465.1 cytochrome c [Cupriavidus sp.]MCA3233379.1 cytochrome c [Cupriavidus sp.]
MNLQHIVMLAIACASGAISGTASAASNARPLEIKLPQETASYKPSTLPGYNLALQNCMICHSAQYVSTQPSTSTRAYWDATVKKMKKPFGAPLKDEDIPAIVDYLVKTYGAEQAQGVSNSAAK